MYQISMRIIIYKWFEVFIIHKQFEFLWISSNVLVLIENYSKLHNLCMNMQFWTAFCMLNLSHGSQIVGLISLLYNNIQFSCTLNSARFKCTGYISSPNGKKSISHKNHQILCFNSIIKLLLSF